MKKIILLLCVATLLLSCKTETKEKLEEAKEAITSEMEENIDSAKIKAETKFDSIKEKAKTKKERSQTVRSETALLVRRNRHDVRGLQ